MAYSPLHMQGNLLCAVDTESTGLNPNVHDLIQICVLPLGPDLIPSRRFKRFELLVKPERPQNGSVEAEKVNKGLLQKALDHGIERWAAVELFREWFNALGLPYKKHLLPLAANYQHDRDFIREWMGGQESYNEIFRSDYRDVQENARLLNDMADWHAEPIPFPRQNLGALASALGVQHINKHDASGDAVATAEIYRRMLRYKDHWNFVKIPVEQVYPDHIMQFVNQMNNLTDDTAKAKATKLFLARTGRDMTLIE